MSPRLVADVLYLIGRRQISKLDKATMNKRTPSRNSQSKGIKVKRVLQICLLLGVCFWLIYQVKRSHDKKKEFDEKDANAFIKAQSADEFLTFGRKDLHPHVQEASKHEKHREDEEEESIEQEEINREDKHEQEQDNDEKESKHEGEHKGGTNLEDEDMEGENKHEKGKQEEEIEDEDTTGEGRGADDDDMDESDQEKMDGDDDREEEFIEEEKEIEEVGEEKESERDEAEGIEQVDHETSTEDQVHDGNSHEAREENYKADDASSAVAHDKPTTSTEGEKVGFENSNEDSARNDLEQENRSSENGAHEAQEEHYRAGDASSAVTHDDPVVSAVSEKVNSQNLNTNLASIDLVQENKTNENNAYKINGDQNNSTSHLEQGAMAENVLPGDNKYADLSMSNTDNKLHENTTSLFNDQQVSSNKYLEVSMEAGNNARGDSTNTSDLFQDNEMLTISNPIQAQNSSVDGVTIGEGSNSKIAELENVNNKDSGNSQSDTNSVRFGKPEAVNTIAGESSNSSSSSVSDASDKTDKPEVDAEADANARSSSLIKEVTDATHSENSSTNDESRGTDENLDSFDDDGTGAADTREQIDFSDTLLGQDEKEAHMDLDTLLKDIVGEVNGKDAAAE